LAYDAIAVIVNKASKESIFEIKDLQDMLNGTDVKHQPVMDGVTATSTVRFAIDSILRGQPLGKMSRRRSPVKMSSIMWRPIRKR